MFDFSSSNSWLFISVLCVILSNMLLIRISMSHRERISKLEEKIKSLLKEEG